MNNTPKPHNQLYWAKRKVGCKNPDCERTKGLTPDQITEAGIPHQGHGYCSTCYIMKQKSGQLPVPKINREEEAQEYALIGQKIKQARDYVGLSVRQLAKEVGYRSPTSLSLIESGQRRIQLTELRKIAKRLNKNISYFFGMDKNSSQSLKEVLKNTYGDFTDSDIKKVIEFIELVKAAKMANAINSNIENMYQ